MASSADSCKRRASPTFCKIIFSGILPLRKPGISRELENFSRALCLPPSRASEESSTSISASDLGSFFILELYFGIFIDSAHSANLPQEQLRLGRDCLIEWHSNQPVLN